MERLTRDLKLHRISPQELIKIVLPSKAIKNEKILETLMYQANSGDKWYAMLTRGFELMHILFSYTIGMYRIQDSYLEACQERLQKQDSRYSEFNESFDCGL